ncbi:MAG: DUF488 domain-containing protein [Actinomycetota bacterium]
MVVFTIGHGLAPPETFAALLRDAGVTLLIDVRTAPGSKRNPPFRREAMELWLPEAGIAYRWEKDLGGFRKPDPDTPNTVLREPMFRGYADHMRTPEFRAALDRVLADAASNPTAVMCSESVWWRCHRRLLSDAAALLGGAEVVHLMHDGRSNPHRLTEGVRRADDHLVYDGGQETLIG